MSHEKPMRVDREVGAQLGDELAIELPDGRVYRYERIEVVEPDAEPPLS